MVFLLGLTGGIAAGKSTVARLLADHGARVIDADDLARRVVEPGRPALDRIREHFGGDVVDATGHLDRAALGRRVFSDPRARMELEAITHPAIHEEFAAEIQRVADADSKAVIVYDVPLLAESKKSFDFDLIAVAHAPASVRIERLQTGRGLSRQEAEARIAAQASDSARLALADIVIDTGGTMETTRAQTEDLWRVIQRRIG